MRCVCKTLGAILDMFRRVMIDPCIMRSQAYGDGGGIGVELFVGGPGLHGGSFECVGE